MIVNIAYDYRMTMIIKEYEICTEHKIHMDCLFRTWQRDRWACLLGKEKKKTTLQHTDQLARLGHYSPSSPYRWSLSHKMITVPSSPHRWSLSCTMITAPSGPYRPLFHTVSTAPSGLYSFLYPLLRFMQA